MQIILDKTHPTIAEFSLSLKYWADVVQIVIYAINLIFSFKYSKTILAEV